MSHSRTSCTLATIATLMIVAAPALQAQERSTTESKAADIFLDAQGQFHGQVVDQHGTPLDGATIVVWQHQQELKRASSDKTGRFQVAGLRTGVYTLELAGNQFPVRVWNAEVAPPHAKPAATLVFGDPAVRGQLGFFDPLNTTTLLLGIAGVTLSAISLNEIKQLDKKVDKLQSN